MQRRRRAAVGGRFCRRRALRRLAAAQEVVGAVAANAEQRCRRGGCTYSFRRGGDGDGMGDSWGDSVRGRCLDTLGGFAAGAIMRHEAWCPQEREHCVTVRISISRTLHKVHFYETKRASAHRRGCQLCRRRRACSEAAFECLSGSFDGDCGDPDREANRRRPWRRSGRLGSPRLFLRACPPCCDWRLHAGGIAIEGAWLLLPRLG